MPEPEDYPENAWRGIYKRHALRTSTCEVCHQPVESFQMWQEPTPGAEDGLLYGHRACVHIDGTDHG